MNDEGRAIGPTPPPVLGVASPCVSICELDEATGMCRGCWRTLDDIRIWSRADDATRREIIARAEASRAHRGRR